MPQIAAFVAAMAVGMVGLDWWRRRASGLPALDET
jgi:hypothetical protein